MPDLQSIYNDPNYQKANAATKAAIFEKWAPQDPNYQNANEATKNAIRQKFGVTQAPAQPQRKPKDNRPKSFWQGVGEGIADVAGNAAYLLDVATHPMEYALGPLVSKVTGVPQPERAGQKALRLERQGVKKLEQASPYRPSETGRFVGQVGATLAIPGGPLAQGAAVGGLLAKNPQDPKSLGTSMAVSALAGKAGSVVGKSVGRVISPKVAPVVQRLKDRGITLTPGQIAGASESALGRTVKATEDKLTSVPGLGDVIKTARRRGMMQFNKAALDEVLAPIGQTVPKSVPVGHEGVAFVERKLGRAYDKILPKINAKVDQQFVGNMEAVASEAETLVPQRAEQLRRIMQNDVARMFQPDGTITGKGLKAIETRLGRRIANYAKSAEPDARDLADALKAVRYSVRDLAARSNPNEAAQLSNINAGWARLVRVQRAAANAVEGTFTPGQLRTATRVADTSVRKGASARGEALMQNFAEDAQKVLPSSIPDSGTPGRIFMTLLAGEGLGVVTGLPGGATASMVAGAAPYTELGGKAAQWLLTGRQGPVSKAVGDTFSRFLPPVATAAGAVAANQ